MLSDVWWESMAWFSELWWKATFMWAIDWFKAYKHTEYKQSTWQLWTYHVNCASDKKTWYFVPWPNEPQLNVNSFLCPLVDELLEFPDGIPMNVYSFSTPQILRCSLLCVACDMPASRKVAGFLRHGANLACTKCLKFFPGGFGEKKDCLGFNRSQWPPRSNSKHCSGVETIAKCKVKTHREKREPELGCRYSVLLKLPYFDPIWMTIIDPMHNLYLGTAKHVLKDVWVEQNLITKKHLEVIQRCVDSVHVPSNFGRIPSEISSSFSGFTADQFKNWTNIFSLFALYDILPSEGFECWKHFVLASQLLNQIHLTSANIQLAGAVLLQFCKRVERMYGKYVVTPNTHMHGHLKDCILDFGPIYGFGLLNATTGFF